VYFACIVGIVAVFIYKNFKINMISENSKSKIPVYFLEKVFFFKIQQ